MPYGWYRALRELMPRLPALRAAVLIGLWPPFLGGYAYFMTETLLLTLTGFAFALTLRALRRRRYGRVAARLRALARRLFHAHRGAADRRGLPAVGLAAAAAQAAVAACWRAMLSLVLIIPAGLHARAALGYFAPLGNLYLNEIYHAGNNKSIQIDFGPQGVYIFGSPSYYNPTFYPFSDWTTSRHGRAEHQHRYAQRPRRLAPQRWQQMPPRSWSARWHDFAENLCYLLFGQSWPDNDRGSIVCWLSSLVALAVRADRALGVALAAGRGWYRGREWLLPLCALLSAGAAGAATRGNHGRPLPQAASNRSSCAALALAWHVRGGLRANARAGA